MFSVVVIVIQQLYAIMNNCKSNSVRSTVLEEWEIYYISISI